jgi:hypothetical protein
MGLEAMMVAGTTEKIRDELGLDAMGVMNLRWVYLIWCVLVCGVFVETMVMCSE